MRSYKPKMSKAARGLRLLASSLDPRAWLHLVKLVNYYNYTHVEQKRLMQIGTGVRMSPDTSFANGARVSLGDRVRLGARTTIWAGHTTGRVLIGDDTMFGPDVLVTASTYSFNEGSPVTDQAMDEADVVIGRDVWIGARVVVLPGATIGDGCVIGAQSVVRGHIPPMSVAVGAPARVVGQRRLPEPGSIGGGGA